MRITFYYIVFFLSSPFLQAQAIYVSSSTNAIYRLNLDDCTYAFVCQANRQIYDIAFHPDGTLYGISGNGNLFVMDTLSGNTSVLHMFTGQSFNSLTIGADGIVYTIGNDGELWTYNLLTGTATFLGDVGYAATGDLTFYKGELYCAVTGDRIVRIPINNVQGTMVIINDDIPGNILGIVSDVVNCTEINCYTITNGFSDIYLVNFQTNTLDLVCQLNITIGGGASTSEFLASSPLQIDSAQLNLPACNSHNGTATIIASGGYGAYQFSLDNGITQSSPTFSNLGEGWYTAIVSDQSGCEDTIEFQLMAPSMPHIDSVILQPAICGLANGLLMVMASNGTAPYTYSLNGGSSQSSNSFTNMTGGEYVLMVTDQQNCFDSMTVLLDGYENPLIDSIISQPATCHMDNGFIEMYASQGVGNLSYSINNQAFQPAGFFSNLPPGPYTVNIMDSLGCHAAQQVVLDSIPPATIIFLDVSPTACGAANGEAEITTDTPVGVSFALNLSTFQSQNTFANLMPGEYTAYIQDENGCLDSMHFTIQPSTSPSIQIVSVAPEQCDQINGSIEVTSMAGAGIVQYSAGNNTYQLSNVFTNLTSGAYTLFLLDEDGCQDSITTTVPAEDGITLNSLDTSPSECAEQTGSFTVYAESINEPLTYSLDNLSMQDNPEFTNLAAGNHLLHILDAAGCLLDTTITIAKHPCPIYIPNVFSPNGDGVNDLFQIRVNANENIRITRFFIFDRWGNSVYERMNLPAQSNEGWWDGTFKHFTMNPGVFAYYLEIEFENGLKETYKGNVTLIR